MRPRTTWIVRALSAAVVLAVAAWWVVPRWLAEPPQKPNVILISIDTCRADHLGCYDPARSLTPNIDRFAETATLYANAVAPAPLTLPSHTSMLTGKIPLVHGTHVNGVLVSSENVTLAEVLGQAGYDTGAIVSAIVLDRRQGLDQGFQTYNDRLVEAGAPRTERHARTTSQAAMGWLDQRVNQQPFFLFLHYFDPHDPYRAPEGYAERFGPEDAQQYAAEVAYVDHYIGQVLDRIKELGLYESSLIIITADHGEMLGEHGEIDHGFFIYQPAIKVPLIVKLPGQRQPRRVDEAVGLVDIVPTVCSAAGVEPPANIQGRDLLSPRSPQDPGAASERYLYTESMRPLIFYNAHPLSGLVGRRWKYIHSARPELYDLLADPNETNDLTQSQPDQAMLMSRRLRALFSDLADRAVRAEQADLDSRTREMLAGLGYAGAGRRMEMVYDVDGDDAKDLIDYHNAFTYDLLDLRREGKNAEAIELCRKLVAQRPQATQSHASLGNLLELAGRNEEALVHYSRCVELDPNEPMIRVARGDLYARMGQIDDALADYQEALTLDPGYIEANMSVAQMYLLQGQPDKAAHAYQAVVATRPGHVRALLNLASLYVDHLDAPDKALSPAKRAVDLTPANPRALATYGWVLAKIGRPHEALTYLRSAVDQAPTVTGHYWLGWTLEQLGRTDEAIAQYEAAADLLGDAQDSPIRRTLTEAMQRLGPPGSDD